MAAYSSTLHVSWLECKQSAPSILSEPDPGETKLVRPHVVCHVAVCSRRSDWPMATSESLGPGCFASM